MPAKSPHNPGDRASITEVLITTTLIQIIGTATMLAMAPIAPRAAQDFGVDPHFVGFQISLIYIFGAAGSAFAGPLVNYLGAIRVEQLSLMLFAAGLLGLAPANLMIGAVASALIGVGYGVQNPASAQILSKIVPPERRNIIFSIKQAGVPAGVAMASLGLPLLDEMIGWRAGFVVLAVVPIALTIYLQREALDPALKNITNRTDERVDWLAFVFKSQKRALQRPFLSLSLITLFYSSVQLTVSTFLVLMLVEDMGWPLVSAAAIAALVQVAGAFGRVLWGLAGDKTGSGMAILGLIGLICTAGLVLLSLIPDMPQPLLIALLCSLGATASGWNGVAMAEMAYRSTPNEASTITGAILVYTFFGVVAGPSLFAVLYDEIGVYGPTYGLFAAASGIGTLLAFGSALQARRLVKS